MADVTIARLKQLLLDKRRLKDDRGILLSSEELRLILDNLSEAADLPIARIDYDLDQDGLLALDTSNSANIILPAILGKSYMVHSVFSMFRGTAVTTAASFLQVGCNGTVVFKADASTALTSAGINSMHQTDEAYSGFALPRTSADDRAVYLQINSGTITGGAADSRLIVSVFYSIHDEPT